MTTNAPNVYITPAQWAEIIWKSERTLTSALLWVCRHRHTDSSPAEFWDALIKDLYKLAGVEYPAGS